MGERDQLDLWAASHTQAVAIEEFLDWCQDQNISLCQHVPGHNFPTSVIEPRHQILYRYFGVDWKRLEEQRRALVKETTEARDA